MTLIACDFHTRFRQIATVNPQTGELIERRLEHENRDVEKFYGPSPHSIILVDLELTLTYLLLGPHNGKPAFS